MTRDHETPPKDTSWLGIGAVLAAIGASVCCVGPLLLLSLDRRRMDEYTHVNGIDPPIFSYSIPYFYSFGVPQALFNPG